MRACCGANILVALITTGLAVLTILPVFGPFFTAVPAQPPPRVPERSGPMEGAASQTPEKSTTPAGPPQPGARAPPARLSFFMLSLFEHEAEDDEHTRDREYVEDHEGTDDHEDGEHPENSESVDGPEDRKGRDGRDDGHTRPVDAHSCVEGDGRPDAFCRRVVPSLTMWALAWVMVLMTALTVSLPLCLSCRPRARMGVACALVASVAMVVSIATLASARGGIAADMSAAAPVGQPTDIEVAFGWAFGLAVCCAILQTAVTLAFFRTACRRSHDEGVAEGMPLPEKDSASASANAIVVGQPVDHNRLDADNV